MPEGGSGLRKGREHGEEISKAVLGGLGLGDEVFRRNTWFNSGFENEPRSRRKP